MFTVNRESLADELAVIQSVAERKTTIPVLAFVLFQVSDGTAKLTATDIDVSITTQVEAVGDSYSGCIPIKQLSSLVKLLDGESIQFNEKPNQRIEIKAGSSKHVLATLPADQFPAVETATGDAVQVPAGVLGAMLRRTSFCAGQEGDGKQWVFQCVHFEVENRTLTMVATNSRQLGAAESPIDSDAKFSAMVPVKAVGTLEKLCAGSGDISFIADANRATFQSGVRTLSVRLMEGQFPAWRSILPDSLKHQTVVSPGALVASVKRACVTTREASMIRHPIALSFSKKQLQITSQSEEGESTDTIPINCESLNGSSVDVRANGEQIVNFIARTEGQITCAFNDEARLIQFGIEGDASYKYITMALR